MSKIVARSAPLMRGLKRSGFKLDKKLISQVARSAPLMRGLKRPSSQAATLAA